MISLENSRICGDARVFRRCQADMNKCNDIDTHKKKTGADKWGDFDTHILYFIRN